MTEYKRVLIQSGERRRRTEHKINSQIINRMHDYQENTNLFGNVQNVLFLLRLTDDLFLLWQWLFWIESNFQVTKKQQQQQQKQKKAFTRGPLFRVVQGGKT